MLRTQGPSHRRSGRGQPLRWQLQAVRDHPRPHVIFAVEARHRERRAALADRDGHDKVNRRLAPLWQHKQSVRSGRFLIFRLGSKFIEQMDQLRFSGRGGLLVRLPSAVGMPGDVFISVCNHKQPLRNDSYVHQESSSPEIHPATVETETYETYESYEIFERSDHNGGVACLQYSRRRPLAPTAHRGLSRTQPSPRPSSSRHRAADGSPERSTC